MVVDQTAVFDCARVASARGRADDGVVGFSSTVDRCQVGPKLDADDKMKEKARAALPQTRK
jgi:hypothetical protein